MAKFIGSDTKRISLKVEGYSRGYNPGGETTMQGPHVSHHDTSFFEYAFTSL
jgi:hypothetical protein